MYPFNKIQRKELQDEYFIRTKTNSNITIDEDRNIDLIDDLSVNEITADLITVKTLNFGGDIIVTNTYNTLVDTDMIIVNDLATINDISASDIQVSNLHSDSIYGHDISANTLHTNTATINYATISDGDKICVEDISATVASFGDLSANNAVFIKASILSGDSVYIDDMSANTGYIHDLSINTATIQHATIIHGDNITINDLSANNASIGDLSVNNINIQQVSISSGDMHVETGAVHDLSVNTLVVSERLVTENVNLEYDISDSTQVAYLSLDTSSNIYLWSDNAVVDLTEVALHFTRKDKEGDQPIKFEYPIKSFAVDNSNVIIGQPTFPRVGHTGQVTIFNITFTETTYFSESVNDYGQSVDIDGSNCIISGKDYVFIYDITNENEADASINIPDANLVKIKDDNAICFDGTNIHYITKNNGAWSVHSSNDYSSFMYVPSVRDDIMAFDGDNIIVSNQDSIFVRDLSYNSTIQQIDVSSTSFYLVPDKLAVCDYINNVTTTYGVVDTSYVFDASIQGISGETGKRGASMNATGTVLSVSNKDGLNSHVYKWYKNTWNFIETIIPAFDSIDTTILNIKCLPEVSSFATDIDNGNLILNENEIRSVDVFEPLPNQIFAQYLLIFNDTSTNLVEAYSDYSANEVIEHVTDISADTIFETNYTDSVYSVNLSTVIVKSIETIVPTNQIFPDFFIIYKDSSTNLLGSYDPDITMDTFLDTVNDISADAIFSTNGVDNEYIGSPLNIEYPDIDVTESNLVTFATNKIVPKRFIVATNPTQDPVENFYTFVKTGNDRWDLEMSYISDISYGVFVRSYTIKDVPESQPICLVGDYEPSSVTYSGTVSAGTHESGATYFWGTVTIRILANFNYFNIFVKDSGTLNSPSFIYTTQCFDTTVQEEGELDADLDLSYNIGNSFLFNDNHQIINVVKNFGLNKFLIKFECDERAIRDDVDKKLYVYDPIDTQDVMSVIVENPDPSSNKLVLFNDTFDVSYTSNSTEESILKRFDFASIGGYNKEYSKVDLTQTIPLSSEVDDLQIVEVPSDLTVLNVSKAKIGNSHFIDKITVDGDAIIHGTLEVNTRINTIDGSFVNVDVSENLNVYGTHNISSDARIKTNVEDIDGLKVIGQLKPQKYMKYGTNAEAGFIAQDVLGTDVSFAVTDTEPLLLNYNSIFTFGIKAIQELNEKIAVLTEQNALLNKRIDELSKKI